MDGGGEKKPGCQEFECAVCARRDGQKGTERGQARITEDPCVSSLKWVTQSEQNMPITVGAA